MAKTQRAKIRAILEHVKPAGLVLDLGSGPGFLEEEVAAIAVDIDLKSLRRLPGLRVLASGDSLPFRTGTFDMLFCIDTIHKLKTEAEIARVLKPGGRAVISSFCNKYNSAAVLSRLSAMFAGHKIEKTFVIATEQEFDAVIVLQTSALEYQEQNDNDNG